MKNIRKESHVEFVVFDPERKKKRLFYKVLNCDSVVLSIADMQKKTQLKLWKVFEMGNISFLTGGGSGTPPSFGESIYLLENTSVVFLSAWRRTPIDYLRAARASQEAMQHLDHIVNEIMRARDQMQSDGCYSGSPLELQLNITRAISVSPVTRAQQDALASLGPGNGTLPSAGLSLTMEKLLNKIKHRRTTSANFRISESGEHVFLIGVDKPNRQPDSIVEFVISDFCKHCNDVAGII